jgi:hypothetical protein
VLASCTGGATIGLAGHVRGSSIGFLSGAGTAIAEPARVPAVVCSVGRPTEARAAACLRCPTTPLRSRRRRWAQGPFTWIVRRPREALPPRLVPRFPPELHGKCLNCLSSSHRVVTCRLPQRCLRCKGFHHRARDCKRLRAASSARTIVPGDLGALH